MDSPDERSEAQPVGSLSATGSTEAALWLGPLGLSGAQVAEQVLGSLADIAQGEARLAAVALVERQADPRRQQQRLAEGGVRGHGVWGPGLELSETAGLAPHPVGDRAGETESLRAQRVHVDRVAVAGDAGVAAAEVVAELPDRGQLRVLRHG